MSDDQEHALIRSLSKDGGRKTEPNALKVQLTDAGHQLGIAIGGSAVRINLPQQIGRAELSMLLYEAWVQSVKDL